MRCAGNIGPIGELLANWAAAMPPGVLPPGGMFAFMTPRSGMRLFMLAFWNGLPAPGGIIGGIPPPPGIIGIAPGCGTPGGVMIPFGCVCIQLSGWFCDITSRIPDSLMPRIWLYGAAIGTPSPCGPLTPGAIGGPNDCP